MTLAELGAWSFFTIGLLLAVFEDLRLRTIPNMTYLVLLIGTVFAFHGLTVQEIFMRIAAALLMGAVLLIIATVTGGFGGGDVKLIACMMLYFEALPNMFAILFSCVFALMFFGAFKAINKVKLKSVAFAPFLCAGYMVITIEKIWR